MSLMPEKNFLLILQELWELINRIVVVVLCFKRHIVDWFKNPKRLEQLRSDDGKIAVAIKENLKNGDYRTVNCIFNKNTNQIEDMSSNGAQGIESTEVDNEVQNAFGNKPMVILS